LGEQLYRNCFGNSHFALSRPCLISADGRLFCARLGSVRCPVGASIIVGAAPDEATFPFMSPKKTTISKAAAKLPRKKPTWSDVKAAIANYERPALIGIISDLYAYSTPNKNFLHARFSLGSDALKPYKKIIEDALFPDVMANDSVEIATAKKAISDYGKAVGDPKGMLELMLYFVECGARFSLDCGYVLAQRE